MTPDREHSEPGRTSQQRHYVFSLVLGRVPALTQAVTDAIFEAGCSDATPSVVRGRLCLDFTRQAESLGAAIVSAVGDVRRAGASIAINPG